MSLDESQALNAAKQYVLQRNVQAAVDIYRKIIEADPSDLTAINTLGDLYVSTGQVQDAIAHFSRVADSYIEGGFARKAIATLTKIIAVDPSNTGTATKLADLYAQAGLPSEARQHYLQIADALTRKGETLDALSVYSKIVELDPSNTSTRIKLGELYLREGMNEQAYAAFVTAAEQLTSKGENRRALNAYKEALDIRPDSREALAAARTLMSLLGVANPDKSLRNPASQGAVSGGLAMENSAEPAGSDLSSASTPLDLAPPSSDSFVVQEISKAERLVGYGQVNQAISMLRDVLRDKPDSIDVHIKLKDIYLRTGMMAEAAHECVALERIHEARGESDRARDYAVRASRLTQLIEQPSGDLPKPTRKPVEEVEPRLSSAPLEAAAPHDTALKPRPVSSRVDTRPVQPSQMVFSVIPSNPPAVEVPTAFAAGLPQGSHSKLVESSPPVAEARLAVLPAHESALVQVSHVSTAARERSLPALFAGSWAVEMKRGRLTAAGIAAGVFVLFGVSAVIGAFAYDAHLDKQYAALALAAPPLAEPSPPPVLEFESDPVQENEPITVVVTPSLQTDAPAQRQNPEPEPIKTELPAPAQPASEPPKIVTQSSPMPPRAIVSPDGRVGTEMRTPAGVPVDVPIAGTHPGEPPPRAVRQSPGVVLGSAVSRVDPVYPAAARQARQTGAVAVEVTISAQGNVTSARALSGPELLRNAAVMAARAWKFKASTLGGVPVTTTTTIVFNFKL